MAYRRDEDLAAWAKNNWWLVIVLFVGIGVWLSTPLMHQTGADSVDLPGSGSGQASEQSLRTLDDAANPQGAPGSTIDMSMPGQSAYARKDGSEGQASSLYQAPGGASGAPISSEEGKPAAEGTGDGSLAAALKRVGESVSASASSDHGGWGGQSVRTGFTAPKASFSQPSRSGSGGSSSASYQVVNKAFGLGGNPGLIETRGPDLKDAKVGTKIGKSGGSSNLNTSLEALKGVEKAASNSLLGGTERAAGMGQKTFDAAAGRSRSVTGGAGAGGAGVGMGEGDVPANLKANDYSQVSKKDIQPPPIQAAKEVKSNNNNQMMMMMMMMMMGGMLGPSFSAMAPAMMMGMSMSQ